MLGVYMQDPRIKEAFGTLYDEEFEG